MGTHTERGKDGQAKIDRPGAACHSGKTPKLRNRAGICELDQEVHLLSQQAPSQ